MNNIMEWFQENRQVALVVGGVTLSLVALKRILYGGRNGRPSPDAFPRNKVVLVQMRRGPAAPSLSPFPLKLETYLRMANIPYENVFGMIMSSKGKTPYILYNGEEIADSQLIIEFLNREKGVDLNGHLTPEQKAIARAFLKMTEENLYWTLAGERWVYADFESKARLIPQMTQFYAWMIRRHVQKEMWGHGIGRHSREEMLGIMEKDMRALSDYLGVKQFFLGDLPSEVDSAIFGMLAQFMWHAEGSPQQKLMNGELKNLVRYCERMKKRFWPDWDDCITHNHTREAKK